MAQTKPIQRTLEEVQQALEAMRKNRARLLSVWPMGYEGEREEEDMIKSLEEAERMLQESDSPSLARGELLHEEVGYWLTVDDPDRSTLPTDLGLR